MINVEQASIGKSMGPRDLNVCIVSPYRNAYCETFIQAHLERLPCRVVPVFGKTRWEDADGVPLTTNRPGANEEEIGYSIETSFAGGQKSVQCLVEFFECKNIDAVLAEYGTTAVKLQEYH